MDREAWQTTVHGVTKSRTRLSDETTTTTKGKVAGVCQNLPAETQLVISLTDVGVK